MSRFLPGQIVVDTVNGNRVEIIQYGNPRDNSIENLVLYKRLTDGREFYHSDRVFEEEGEEKWE